MQKLFSPCKLGPLELSNPIVFLPFFTSYAGTDGMVNETLIRHYQHMAASGAGLIIVEASTMRHSTMPNTIHVFAPEHVSGLKRLVDVIHAEGAKAILQLNHHGRFAFRPESLAPSPVPPFGMMDLMPKAMTEEDMALVIADFAESAAIVKDAGFDGVELHGGTGYLLASFMSPHTNKRNDEYGGSVENRTRFPRRVFRAIREKVGDYPVGYRFMVKEYIDGGLSLEDGIAAAKFFVPDLAPAYLSVTAGMYECWAMQQQNKEKSFPGYMLPESAAVKKAFPDIAIIAAGNLQTKEVCEKALTDGIADAIGLGRVLFADSDWINKLSGKNSDKVRACVFCNTCIKQVSANKPVFCSRWSKDEKETSLQGIPQERLAKATK